MAEMINSHTPSIFTFHIETNLLICNATQLTGFNIRDKKVRKREISGIFDTRGNISTSMR